jgi:hypothetical protein
VEVPGRYVSVLIVIFRADCKTPRSYDFAPHDFASSSADSAQTPDGKIIEGKIIVSFENASSSYS